MEKVKLREGRMEKPTVNLSGQDGNVFSIIGRVNKALTRSGQKDKAEQFTDRAMAAGSYDEVLRLCFEFVEVK